MIPQGYFNGIKVFVTESCVTSVPRRKHKKRRIQKKWLKKYGKTFEPFRGLVGVELYNEKVLCCHPKHWDKFIKMAKKGGFEVCWPIKKLTDNEIVKAFEMHLLDSRDCELCPYGPAHYRCDIELLKDAIDLINRIQAENERLKKGWKADIQLTSEAKVEAVAEFAEALNNEIEFGTFSDCYIRNKIKKLLNKFIQGGN